MKLLEQVEKGYKMPCINNSDPHIKFQIPISEFRNQFAILNFEFYFFLFHRYYKHGIVRVGEEGLQHYDSYF